MIQTAEHFWQNKNLVAFPKLGLEFDIDPTAFTVFGLEIKWYGVLIALGALLAVFYCFSRMEKTFGVDSDRATDAVLAGFFGAIIGARLYYIIFNEGVTLAEFFNYRDGGLAIYGGLIGALLVGGIVAKIRKLKLAPFFDAASMGFLIGQGIGRWGNFVNKEAFGAATELPWGMSSASIQYTLGGGSNELVMAHPCFLYESLWCLLGFLILHFYVKHRKFDGEIFLMYTAWYGLGRFFIEGLRTDSLMLGRLRVSQMLALVCFIAAVGLIIYFRWKIKHDGGYILYVNSEASKALIAETKDRISAKEQKRSEKLAKKAEAAVKEAKKAVSEAKEAKKDAEHAVKEAEQANAELEDITTENEKEQDNNGSENN